MIIKYNTIIWIITKKKNITNNQTRKKGQEMYTDPGTHKFAHSGILYKTKIWSHNIYAKDP